MAEPFNPEAFRQQMTQGQPSNPAIPSPVPAPAPVPSPMPAVAAPQPMAPAQHGHQPGQAQPYVPHAPQGGQPQPQHRPHPQNQHPMQYPPQQAQQPNPAYKHPQQANVQPPFQQAPPAMQQGYAPQQQFQAHNPMQVEAAQEPAAKRSLFKRKKLKAAASEMNAPQNLMQGGEEKAGLSRLIVFASGLVLGVFGTMISIMLFSGNEPQRATVANGQLSPASQTVIQGSSQAALTDEMLLEKARQGGTP